MERISGRAALNTIRPDALFDGLARLAGFDVLDVFGGAGDQFLERGFDLPHDLVG